MNPLTNSNQNSDRELWRKSCDPWAPRIYATESGEIVICVGGVCRQQSIEAWHANAGFSWSPRSELLKAIEVAVRVEGSQKKAAARMGVSPQYLGDIRKGKRDIPDRVAKCFGLTKATFFVPIPEPEEA